MKSQERATSSGREERAATRIPLSIACLILATQLLIPGCNPEGNRGGGCTPKVGSPGSQSSTPIGEVPPTGLSYTSPPPFHLGAAIVPLVPSYTSGGFLASHSVQPGMPPGLTLSTSNGRITGTPTQLSPLTTYTVTASNSGGSDSAELSIQVLAPLPLSGGDPGPLSATEPPPMESAESGSPGPPENLIYSQVAWEFTVGVEIDSLVPTYSGGVIVLYAVVPSLPVGLSIDPIGGKISGIPREVAAPRTYTVAGSSPTGVTSTTVRISVIGS